MKIWVLSDDFPSRGNPSFVFVEQLVEALVQEGVEIGVLAPQSITKLLLRGRRILPVHSIEHISNGKSFDVYRPFYFSLGNKPGFFEPIIMYVRRLGISRILAKRYKKGDILYGHFWHSALALLPMALKYNAPLFVACGEGDNAMEDMAKKLSKCKREALRNATNGVICVSSDNLNRCLNLGFAEKSQMIVLPNCVDDTLFKPQDSTALKTSLGITNDDFTIAFVGAFIKRKGSKLLSDAIDIIHNPHIKSLFIGRPLAGDDCSPNCCGIVYKGPLEHEKLPDYLSCADVFVLPTLKEGCSNAIVEALACGVPVISSDRPFNDDILDDGNSIRVNPESVDEIADAIKKMVENRAFYSSLKDNAIERAGNYSINQRARKIIEFIKDKV